jgi:multiple sugar transport system permease protein
MNASTSLPARTSATRPFNVGRWVSLLIALLIVIVILLPFWWMIKTSLSTNREMYASPVTLWPVGFTTQNYARVLGFLDIQASQALGGSGQKLNFFLYLRNSMIVSTLMVLGQLTFSSLAAYAFARLHWPLRDKVFMAYLIALMIPGIVTLIPNYGLLRDLELLKTFPGIVAPGFLFSAFSIFFLRQFFLGINKELEESAKLDGASTFGTFMRIILPISGPPMATLAILTFIGTWNEYLWPLLVAGSNEEVRVLTVALGIFRSQTPQGAPDWSGLMAGSLLSALPGLLLFLVLGRRIINSIQYSGFK